MSDDGKAPTLTIDQVKEALNKINPNAEKSFEALLKVESEGDGKATTTDPKAQVYDGFLKDKLIPDLINADKFVLGFQVNDAMVRNGSDPKVAEAVKDLFGEQVLADERNAVKGHNAAPGSQTTEFYKLIDQMNKTLQHDIDSDPKSPMATGQASSATRTPQK